MTATIIIFKCTELSACDLAFRCPMVKLGDCFFFFFFFWGGGGGGGGGGGCRSMEYLMVP